MTHKLNVLVFIQLTQGHAPDLEQFSLSFQTMIPCLQHNRMWTPGDPLHLDHQSFSCLPLSPAVHFCRKTKCLAQSTSLAEIGSYIRAKKLLPACHSVAPVMWKMKRQLFEIIFPYCFFGGGVEYEYVEYVLKLCLVTVSWHTFLMFNSVRCSWSPGESKIKIVDFDNWCTHVCKIFSKFPNHASQAVAWQKTLPLWRQALDPLSLAEIPHWSKKWTSVRAMIKNTTL